MLQGTSISKLHHFTYDQDNTPKSNVFDKKMGKNTVTVKPLPTSLDPPHGDGRRRNEAMSQVMSTSPAHPYHTNCLYVPNAAADGSVSFPANVLLKLAFLNAGVKEMLTCIPK